MTNPYYNGGSFPATGAPATSASMRAELSAITAGFDKLPVLSGNANKLVVVNSSASALEVTTALPPITIADTSLIVEDNGDNTRRFRFEANVITPGATRVLTVPDANLTLVGEATAQTLTNKTLNLASNTLVATSAQIAAAVTDETGSGSLVFGTNPTISGATLSGNVTLSGGTANGVLYLNGSKVATSGSALTFDGSQVYIKPSSGFQPLKLAGFGGSIDTFFYTDTAYWGWSDAAALGGNAFAGHKTDNYLFWQIAGSEQMRLTSTGLGIGTSSPAFKFDAQRATAGTVGRFFSTGGTDANISIKNNTQEAIVGADNTQSYLLNAGAYPWTFWTNNLERMRLDSAGNIGLGVTPSAWNSGLRAIQVGYSASIDSPTFVANTRWSNNAFVDSSGGFKYINTAVAQVYEQDNNGKHIWYTAPSGTAGNAISFTQAMTLDASGRLGIGLTNPAYRLDVEISGGPYNARFANSSTSTSEYNVTLWGQGASGSATGYIGTGGSAVSNTSFANNFVVGTQTSNALVFNTTDTERARITSGGNFLINNTYTTASKLIVGGDGTSNAAFAGVFADSTGATLLSIRNDGYIDTGTRTVSPYNNTTASAANMFVDSAGGLYRSTSSLKYKTDVQDATHGLAEVMQLRPVTYKGKNDGDKIFGGLIAEEVHAAGLTEFVQYAVDGTPDALAYGNMVSLLTKAIQEQQAIITALTARVAALES